MKLTKAWHFSKLSCSSDGEENREKVKKVDCCGWRTPVPGIGLLDLILYSMRWVPMIVRLFVFDNSHITGPVVWFLQLPARTPQTHFLPWRPGAQEKKKSHSAPLGLVYITSGKCHQCHWVGFRVFKPPYLALEKWFQNHGNRPTHCEVDLVPVCCCKYTLSLHCHLLSLSLYTLLSLFHVLAVSSLSMFCAFYLSLSLCSALYLFLSLCGRQFICVWFSPDRLIPLPSPQGMQLCWGPSAWRSTRKIPEEDVCVCVCLRAHV